MSLTLKSTDVHLGQNLVRKGLTDVSQILTRSRTERDMGLLYAKDSVSMVSAVWAQCTNVTDRPTEETEHSPRVRPGYNRMGQRAWHSYTRGRY